ncbi:MAG: hypothetical protein AAF750_12045 [Planctomycetota bacterium]
MSRHVSRFSLDLLAIALTIVVCPAWLVIFEEQFSRGATWSGLNPSGGGPGFLLLLTAGGLSLFCRSQRAKSMKPLPTTLHAGTLSALCGIGFWLIAGRWSALPGEAMLPLSSSIVGAFFVPRVVVSVLNDTWNHAEMTKPGAGVG